MDENRRTLVKYIFFNKENKQSEVSENFISGSTFDECYLIALLRRRDMLNSRAGKKVYFILKEMWVEEFVGWVTVPNSITKSEVTNGE